MDNDSGDNGTDELRLRQFGREEWEKEWLIRLTEWCRKFISKARTVAYETIELWDIIERNERSVIFKQEDDDGRERVTEEKERISMWVNRDQISDWR